MRKVVTIFGGSGGIGQAICSTCEKDGMIVYLTSYRKIIRRQNPHILHCDVTKNQDVEDAISYVLKRERKIDIVINSVATPLKLKTVESLTVREFEDDIDTILIGGINIAKSVIAAMKARRKGIVINILSALVLGKVSTRMSSYTSAKYGLLGFTKCLAMELAPFNISVFGISPFFVETNLIKAFPDKFIEIEEKKRKNGKLIQPTEVAGVVLDMIRNTRKYKTGDNIEIN